MCDTLFFSTLHTLHSMQGCGPCSLKTSFCPHSNHAPALRAGAWLLKLIEADRGKACVSQLQSSVDELAGSSCSFASLASSSCQPSGYAAVLSGLAGSMSKSGPLSNKSFPSTRHILTCCGSLYSSASYSVCPNEPSLRAMSACPTGNNQPQLHMQLGSMANAGLLSYQTVLALC